MSQNATARAQNAPTNTESPRTVIVGGGVAGLTCAARLAAAGRPVTVLEREKTPGGLLRSLELDGVTFDLGPHVLFLDHDGPGEAFLREILAGRPVIRHQFAFAVAAGGRMWKFPNYIDFLKYPARYQLEVLRAALKRRGAPPPEPIPASVELAEKSGDGLYNLLFRDLFAKKTLLSPEALHHHWLARVDRTIDNRKEPFIPRGRVATMLAVLARLRQEYTYPIEGVGEIIKLLAARITAGGGEIATGVNHLELVREGDRIAAVIADGRRIETGHLVWTAPLNALNAALGATEVPELPTVTMRLVMLTYSRETRVPRPYVYTYHPDPKLTANRVYYPESIFRQRGPADREGLCLEMNVATGKAAPPSHEDSLAKAIADVNRLGLYPPQALRESRVVTLPAAMPVYPLDYETRLEAATTPVAGLTNAHAVGRQGGFYFCLTPAAVTQGLKMAAHLLGQPAIKGA